MWSLRAEVPDQSYLPFMDELMKMVRSEVADCAQKAYLTLPGVDAQRIFFFSTEGELAQFVAARGWKRAANGDVVLSEEVKKKHEVPTREVIRTTLHYAREMERII